VQSDWAESADLQFARLVTFNGLNMRKSDPGPSQPQQTSSLLMKLLTLAFAPAAYMLGLACACASFAIRQVFFLLQLPFTITIISLQLVDAVISDILVYLTHQPSLSTQVEAYGTLLHVA